GVVLAVSPFVFGFSDEGTNAWLPHVIVGIGLVLSGLMTHRVRDDAPVASRQRRSTAH
ncbi:MAG: hypothetical protein JWP17_3459, partial [Solirubrobacterales bacterium]|nr:hypothetical protein [Solirubrobacterales bacterium]